MITPINTKRTASLPFPCLSISCPGRTERNDSESVAPVRIDGMKSRIVWVIARDVTNVIKDIVEIDEKIPRFATSIAVTVFMCIPGVMPVNVPMDTPQRIASIISQTIKY